MADGSAYLKHLCGGLTDMDIATAASVAISTLDDERLDLSCFFVSSIKNDSSYESISFEILDLNPYYRYVHLQKRIKHVEFPGLRIPDKVTIGPIMDRQKAASIIVMLNEVFGEKRTG